MIWCISCRIAKSKVALTKSQFDAVLVHISRGLCGRAELVSEKTVTHTECTAQAVPRTCDTEVGNAVIASQIPTDTTDTVVTTAHSGRYCHIF